jgi:uncharacterized protein with von Willebrand factor type A (vWA) domain
VEHVLEDFIGILRRRGVGVSIAESIDAAHALRFIGLEDRSILKDSLSVVLAKSLEEKEIFNECFEQFFSLNRFWGGLNISGKTDIDLQNLSPLGRMILSDDHAGILTSMVEAGRAVRIDEIKFFTQKNLYAMRILDRMGIEGLDRDIEALLQEGSSISGQNAHSLSEARKVMFDAVREYVREQYNLYASGENLRERYLRGVKLTNLEAKDFHRMDPIIKKIAKRLNDVHSRRRRAFRRGQLDFKKTLRKNIAHDEIFFDLMWKRRRIDRPDVIALCDVSRSVRTVVRFFLLFLYRLNEALARRRTFIFCTNIIEVSSIFDEYRVEEAVDKIQTGAGLNILLGRTDYGGVLRDFEKNWIDDISNKTTVIILGDARNNFGDPQTRILKQIQNKSKRIIWLNPENRSFWGLGDSEMKKYLPFCHLARECNTVNHLERVVDSIL